MPSAQTVMLAIHCKRTENVELKAPILQYIREAYSDRDADDAADDLAAVQTLRNELVLAQSGAQGMLRESLAKYFRALTAIEARFPISGEQGHVRLSFPWADAFRPSKKASQSNVHYEKAAVLFNVGAVLSQQALQVERGTGEGITQACRLFQEAAGAFSLLRETEAAKADASPKPVDLSPECCSMLERLMLAQAQECVFHKASLDRKSPGTQARLAKQAAAMYAEVAALFAAPALASHFERSWASHAQMKASLLEVEALCQSGKQHNADEKIALEVSVLQEAHARMQATKRLARAVSAEMAESLAPAEEALRSALAKAQRDNAAVYLERVPAFCDLPPVQGALLVKASAPQGLDASGEALFSGLVPDHSAKALSRYTELADARARELLDALAGATDAARLALRSAELPDLLDALDGAGCAGVPDALLREVEDVERMGGTGHLRGILAEVGELRRAVERDLDEAAAALDGEAAADADARARHGASWPAASAVPPSVALAKGLRDKLAQYRGTLAAAGESDGRVIARLDEQRAALDALTADAAAAAMPRLQAPAQPPPGSDDPAVVVAALRRTVEGLEHLSAERAALEERARETKAKDNAVLGRLLAAPSPAQQDGIFAAELAKYDAVRAEAGRNAEASARLVSQLGPQAAAFRAALAVPAWRSACEGAAAGQRAALKCYREILDHLSEGLRFYMSLQEAVAAHRQQCDDFAYTRALQRDEAAGEAAAQQQQQQHQQQHAQQQQQQQQQAAAAAARMQQMNLASHNPYAPPPVQQQQQQQPMHDYYGHYGGQQQPGQPAQWQMHATPHAAGPPPPPPPPAGHAYGAPPGTGYGAAPPPAAYGAGGVPQPVHGIWAQQQGSGGGQMPPPQQPPPHYPGGGGYGR